METITRSDFFVLWVLTLIYIGAVIFVLYDAIRQMFEKFCEKDEEVDNNGN